MNKHINRLGGAALLPALLLTACGGSSTLHEGERTRIDVGFTDTRLDFSVSESGFYSIFSEGEEDVVCKVFSEAGAMLAEDDDSGSGFNCLLLTRLDAGNYQIEVGGFDTDDRGEAYITAKRVPSESINVGQVSTVQVEAHQPSARDFEITEAGDYRMSTSGQLDTVCTLFSADGTELASNDDDGDGFNCGLSRRLEPGRYTVMIASYSEESGSPTFMVERNEMESFTLTLGQAMASRIADSGDRVLFEFDIAQDGRYIMRTSGDTDTFCELRSSNGEVMDENDDGDEDFNCKIEYALPAGQYQLVVSGYGSSTGSFMVHLDPR